MKLIKYSSPGWIKEFENEFDLREELAKHICSECMNNQSSYIDEVNDELVVVTVTEGGPISKYVIQDMLSTACGCEYGVEGIFEEGLTDEEVIEENFRTIVNEQYLEKFVPKGILLPTNHEVKFARNRQHAKQVSKEKKFRHKQPKLKEDN